jgi:putative transposase
MAYVRVFVHLVWSTKWRLPMLTPALRKDLFPFMGGIMNDLGAMPILINGVEDHVHSLVWVPPTLCVADLVKNAKGGSARWANQRAGRRVLKWQVKYGAFSVYPKDLHVVHRYIARQEIHHRKVNFKSEFRKTLVESGATFDEAHMWE